MALNIKYRSLKAFLHAVETGSFTLGANRLGVTQPSFTALIQDLEHVLDSKLFERSTRAIALTSRSEEHTSELQSLMRNSYAVYCLQKKNNKTPPSTLQYCIR